MAGHLLLAAYSLVVYSHAVYSTITAKQMLATVAQFSTDFSYPRIIEVAAQINYTGFTPDVVGRVDATNAYQGSELNTEYIFGLFASVASSNTTRLLGIPGNSTITEMAIEPPVISFSSIRDFDLGPITIPIQIDAWFLFDNESGLISQYDVSFRRLGWAVDYLKAFLKPQLIEELGSIVGDLTDVDELMHLRAAIDICREHEIHCLGADQQYESTQVCIDHIYQNTAMGEVYEWGGDTAMCRYIHKGMIRYRPHVHCPHIGPSGGGMCIERDYITETTQKLYPAPFLPTELGL